MEKAGAGTRGSRNDREEKERRRGHFSRKRKGLRETFHRPISASSAQDGLVPRILARFACSLTVRLASFSSLNSQFIETLHKPGRTREDSASRACDSLLQFQGIGSRLADSANLSPRHFHKDIAKVSRCARIVGFSHDPRQSVRARYPPPSVPRDLCSNTLRAKLRFQRRRKTTRRSREPCAVHRFRIKRAEFGRFYAAVYLQLVRGATYLQMPRTRTNFFALLNRAAG